MAAGVNFLKLFDADLGVNCRGVEFFMAEQLLDEPDVRPVFQHVRRAGVPQQMARGHAPRHLFDPRGHHARHDIGIERAAVAGQEQRLRARVQGQTRTHGLQVVFEPVNGACADGHDAIFFALAQTHMERAPFSVQVGQFQAAKLGAPDARRVKKFQHRPVADAEGIGHVRHGQQFFDFRQGEHFLGQPLFHPGQFQFAGRIVQDDILSGEPAAKILEDAQAVALRAPAQPLPVGLGATPEPALVTFQNRARDLPGACQVALRRPRQKNFQGIAPAFQRAFGVVSGRERFKVAVTPQGERVGRAAVEVVRSPVVAAALRFRAAGEPFHRLDAFGCGHDYDASWTARVLMCVCVRPSGCDFDEAGVPFFGGGGISSPPVRWPFCPATPGIKPVRLVL